MVQENILNQKIVLTDRKCLDIDRVEGIVAFDENYISILTSGGKINIEGREMKIDELNKDSGRIHITGEITGVFYSGGAKKSAFSRIFK